MTETLPAKGQEITDLRRVGISPDFWYPIAVSGAVRKQKTFAATFAGQRIALYRGAAGAVYALEDRCAHRQVPLSMGMVEGDVLRCCYHAWAYRGDGRISQIPYLPKGAVRPPRGVRAYPVREAYGLVFVFPGDPDQAATTPLPQLPDYGSGRHQTMTFSRAVASEGTGSPAFSLWAAYVPEDAGQRTSHAYGLLMIAKPPVPGALHLAWPFIRRFTERVFAEDRMAVEAEQRAWDEQGQDRNHEVFPLILDLRDVLRSNGVPIRPDPACAATPCPGAQR